MILARGLAGSVPPFALAFFRWSIIFLGLAPIALAEIRQGRIPLAKDAWPILAAGFLGMFLCGGPVYVAGISTTAIHIALIMALSPIVVLLISAALGMEHIGPLQWLGTGAGAGRRAADRDRRPPRSAGQVEGGMGRSAGRVRDARLVRLHTGAVACRAAGLAARAHQPVLRGRRAVLAAFGDPRNVDRAGGGLQHEGGRGLSVCGPGAGPDRLCRLRLARRPLRFGAHLAGALCRPGRERAAVVPRPRRAADLDPSCSAAC